MEIYRIIPSNETPTISEIDENILKFLLIKDIGGHPIPTTREIASTLNYTLNKTQRHIASMVKSEILTRNGVKNRTVKINYDAILVYSLANG